MTTKDTLKASGRFRLPDPPEREPDEVTAFDHVYKPGMAHYLAIHFGSPDTTLVEADRWIVASPESNRSRARRADLLVAFNVSHQIYRDNNGYIVSEQGKPPDFVLEVASVSTASIDTGAKRQDYAALGIPEYWRFDETGEHHGARLAGDFLRGDSYSPAPVDEIAPGVLQGYSPVLNLMLRWSNGRLEWWDPVAERHILTYDDQKSRADTAEARAQQAERQARELAEQLRRLRGDATP